MILIEYYPATNLDLALSLGAKYSKTVVMESFCAPDGSKKAQTLAPMITACNQRNISWLVWEVMNPGNNKDCEF